MGGQASQIDCSCVLPKGLWIEGEAAGPAGETDEKRDRRAVLIRGANFLRPAYLGLSSQELVVKLAEDYSTLKWNSVSKGMFSGQPEFGEVALDSIASVKMNGTQGLQLISSDGKSSVAFAAQAETSSVRDQWVLCLNELLEDWRQNPDSKPKAQLSAAGTSNKDDYFKQRALEIEEREKAAKVKREKYAAGGMKHVAIVMANRE